MKKEVTEYSGAILLTGFTTIKLKSGQLEQKLWKSLVTKSFNVTLSAIVVPNLKLSINSTQKRFFSTILYKPYKLYKLFSQTFPNLPKLSQTFLFLPEPAYFFL